MNFVAVDVLLGTEQIEHMISFSSVAFYSKFARWVVVKVLPVVIMHFSGVWILLLRRVMNDEVFHQLVEDLSPD
jgi:hypothetical protein